MSSGSFFCTKKPLRFSRREDGSDKDRRYDLPVFPMKAIAEGSCLISDAKDKCFLGGRHRGRERPHMTLDGPDTLLIDIIPKLLCGYSGINGVTVSALETVAVLLITSEDPQIMKKRNADQSPLVDVDSGFPDHITHGKPCSCSMDGMITDG